MLTKQQIIFFVGADRTGKSNIAKAFSQQTGIPYFKSSGEHETFLNKQERFLPELRYGAPHLLDVLKQTCHSIILDRGYPCEWVYSWFYRRNTDEIMINYLDQRYAILGAKIIICTRSSFKGINDDLDSRLDSEALQIINNQYLRFSKRTYCKNLVLNVDDECLERELLEITNFINS